MFKEQGIVCITFKELPSFKALVQCGHLILFFLENGWYSCLVYFLYVQVQLTDLHYFSTFSVCTSVLHETEEDQNDGASGLDSRHIALRLTDSVCKV